MKIALDARWIFPKLSGVGIYTRELIREFAAAPDGPEFLLLFESAEVLERTRADTGFDRSPRFTAVVAPFRLFTVANQLRLGGWLHARGVGVYFSPNWLVPALPFALRGLRVTVTLHDLIPIVMPDHAPNSLKSRFFPVYLALMRRIARRADTIFTVSEASRRDIAAHLLGGSDAKVRVAYNGVNPRFTPGASARDPVVLFVGRFDPYKNVPGLVEAFAAARPELPPGTRLRVVGAPDPRYPEARRRADELGLGDAVIWDGNLDGDGLLRAYQTASVLVLASRYEGFGLPVAEAMACGTPVICSDASSLPEVAGDAAVLVPSGDTHALARAIARVMNDPAQRADLSARGLARARRFSWADSARIHLDTLTGKSTP